MSKVAIVGTAGRMGRMLVQEVAAATDLELCAAVDAPGSEELGKDAGVLAGAGPNGVPVTADLAAAVRAADVIIEFAEPGVTVAAAALCAEHRVPFVSGTTALSAEQRERLAEAARVIPVVWAPNMSVGVNALLALVAQAARVLGAGYEIEIVEAHHHHKKDAPSGTAQRLAEVVAAATAEQGTLEERARHGRQGLVPRKPQEIGVHALRAGDIVGEHTVYFCTEGERLELTHRASSRQAFSRGAIRAARWVLTQGPGLYDMQTILAPRAEGVLGPRVLGPRPR